MRELLDRRARGVFDDTVKYKGAEPAGEASRRTCGRGPSRAKASDAAGKRKDKVNVATKSSKVSKETPRAQSEISDSGTIVTPSGATEDADKTNRRKSVPSEGYIIGKSGGKRRLVQDIDFEDDSAGPSKCTHTST